MEPRPRSDWSCLSFRTPTRSVRILAWMGSPFLPPAWLSTGGVRAATGLLPFAAHAQDAKVERLDGDRAVYQGHLHLGAAAGTSRITDKQ
jgi:hypothetical protein